MKGSPNIDLEALTNGDSIVWKRFVLYAAPLMKGMIHRVLSSSGRMQEVDDVLQKAFLRLLQRDFKTLKQFDPKRASLSTFLGVIATSVALDHLRNQTLPPTSTHELDHLEAPVDSSLQESRLDLPPGLLTPRQELILCLLYEDDLSVAEVADLLNIEQQSVRSLRHKAVSRLRGYWQTQERG